MDPPYEVKDINGRRGCTCIKWGSSPALIMTVTSLSIRGVVKSDVATKDVTMALPLVTASIKVGK